DGLPLHRRAARLAAMLSDPDGARRTLSEHCEVAAMLAVRIGVGAAVADALAHAYERWDGAGFPTGVAGEAVPIAIRIGAVARDADLFWHERPEDVGDIMRSRRGRAYDPGVVDAFLAVGPA